MALCKMIKIEDKLMYICGECSKKVKCVRLVPDEITNRKAVWKCDNCVFGKVKNEESCADTKNA